MLTIYEYNRIAGAENSLSYLVVERQPLVGGSDDPEYASRIIVPVHQVESIEAARVWITQQFWAMVPSGHLPGVTRPAYTLWEVPHSQALLCITAEGEQPDDDGYYD